MKRATVNFWVDVVVGAAFLVSALSGLLLLLPLSWRGVTATGEASILLVGVTTWRAVHDWSSVVIVVGIALHCALHYEWIVATARRILGLSPRRTRLAARPGASPAAMTPAAMAPAAMTPAAMTPAAMAPAAMTPAEPDQAVSDLSYRRTPSAERDPSFAPGASPQPARVVRYRVPQAAPARTYSRGAFLTGLAGLAGGALLAGLIADGQSSGAVRPAGLASLNNGQDAGAASAGSQGSDQGYGDGSSGDYGYGDQSAQSGGQSGGATGTTGATVSVDSAACIGCGACLQVCPASVFGWNGGKAVAQNEAACIRCGRCLQACPVGAITVSA